MKPTTGSMALPIYILLLAIIACHRMSKSPPVLRSSSLLFRSKRKPDTKIEAHSRVLHSPLEHQKSDSNQIPLYNRITTLISFGILIITGLLRDLFGKWLYPAHYQTLTTHNGYAPLSPGFDNFYLRRLHARMEDCFERVTSGVPGRHITLVDGANGLPTTTLNLSSYNYLGFAESEGPCASLVAASIQTCGIASASSRAEVGTHNLHVEVEALVASYVGKEDCMVSSMGFATNADIFPVLVDARCLVISDELNHASIRFGTRLSGATLATFQHNDLRDLETKLREAACSHVPWKKVLVVVEGLYSMEGTLCHLPDLIALKRRYKFYLFIDEAHSIGAIGPSGRGICDHYNVDPADVDILMGTFTKSFGAVGGYIAANRAVIQKLRATNPGSIYSEAPAPAILAQILASIRIVSSGQGDRRLKQLLSNSRYLRRGLKRLGYIVFGDDDSPVVPALLLNPAKMPAFSREMLRRKISVVVVGFPGTPLLLSRIRFCVSATHTQEDLDYVLSACAELGGILQLRLCQT